MKEYRSGSCKWGDGGCVIHVCGLESEERISWVGYGDGTDVDGVIMQCCNRREAAGGAAGGVVCGIDGPCRGRGRVLGVGRPVVADDEVEDAERRLRWWSGIVAHVMCRS